jgi:hypothetical protein
MERFSIIIPVKPGLVPTALTALRAVDYPADRYEVFVAEGCRPSRQRNRAAAVATGEILYFLDDDSMVPPDCLARLAGHFATPAVAVVGGPSLTPATDTPWQQAFGAALSSLAGGGGVRNRYRQSGGLRATDDSELILCNLSFRRAVYLANGGLDERLYPNEENELMDRLRKAGHVLLHDPQLAVRRSQRPHLRAFIRQLFTYGRGRAEQTILSRRVSLASLVPAAFVVYLLLLPWLGLAAAGPLALYAALVALTALGTLPGAGWGGAGRLLLVMPLLHVCYGGGLLAGLCRPRFRGAEPEADDVVVKKVKEMGQSW